MDYLGHYREWKGEAMNGPDAEFIAQLAEKNSVAVEERSRMKQECKALRTRVKKLEAELERDHECGEELRQREKRRRIKAEARVKELEANNA